MKNVILFGCLLLSLFSSAQSGIHEVPDSLLPYSHKKIIPEEFRLSILTALGYFPELKNLSIRVRIKPAYTPLSTKPAFWSMIKRKSKRTYIITISNKTLDTLTHLLYENLNFEERIGIMGHELSHVVDFDNKNFFQSTANAIGHLSKRFLDRMEFNTDRTCIEHGLGQYLEAYSLHVRTSMHVHYWRGVDNVFKKNDHIERYMNPGTIERYMIKARALPSRVKKSRAYDNMLSR